MVVPGARYLWLCAVCSILSFLVSPDKGCKRVYKPGNLAQLDLFHLMITAPSENRNETLYTQGKQNFRFMGHLKHVKVVFSSIVRGLVLAGEVWISPTRFCWRAEFAQFPTFSNISQDFCSVLLPPAPGGQGWVSKQAGLFGQPPSLLAMSSRLFNIWSTLLKPHWLIYFQTFQGKGNKLSGGVEQISSSVFPLLGWVFYWYCGKHQL